MFTVRASEDFFGIWNFYSVKKLFVFGFYSDFLNPVPTAFKIFLRCCLQRLTFFSNILPTPFFKNVYQCLPSAFNNFFLPTAEKIVKCCQQCNKNDREETIK
jgi:hypothetical protein